MMTSQRYTTRLAMALATVSVAVGALSSAGSPHQPSDAPPADPSTHAGARPWDRVSAEEQRADPPVVQTTSGTHRGFAAMPGVDGFLGMRYGAPPTDQLRWSPPAPATAETGVQDAVAFGNPCPALPSSDGPASTTEDCLFLNLWRPTDLGEQDTRPVHVYLHGGGFTRGSSVGADMAELVQRTGVIGISLNYRLGVLGFLSTSGLTAEAGESGNYGLLDQQLALRWVRDNVAAFGGDPARVTIAGESSGAWSVCLHLSSPDSQGLFSQAVLQSAAASCPTQTQDEAEARGSGLATRLGCAPGDGQVACLRALPVDRLLAEFGAGPPFPVRGTPSVPADPREAITSGDFARVPVVIGVNRDEGRTFSVGFVDATAEEYAGFVRASFGAEADEVLARYPWPANADRFTAAYLVGDIMTDSGLVLSAGACVNLALMRDLALHTPTYAYEFAHRTGPGIAPVPGYAWGAGHAAELAYLFPTFTTGVPIPPQFGVGERLLALEMKARWGAFVRSGSPNGPLLTRWPTFEDGGRLLQLREAGGSRRITVGSFRQEHQCDYWDEHPVTVVPGSPAAP